MAKTVPGYTSYPGDYAIEIISTCSLAAQGLWKRLEDLMHTSDRYGYLSHLGRPMPDALACRRIGCTLEEYNTLIAEMDEAGWLEREKKSLIIYSEALVSQEEKRTGNRDRKRKSRKGEITGQERIDYDAVTNQFAPDLQTDELSTPPRNSLESINDGHNEVTLLSHPPNGKGNGNGNGSSSTCISLPQEQEQPPALREDAMDPRKVAERAVRELASNPAGMMAGLAAGKPKVNHDVSANPMRSVMVEAIALASPAARANGWTELAIHGKWAILNPIVEAVKLEVLEQGLSEGEVANWLLKQVRQVTELVAKESGWEKYWTSGRQGRFFENVEYREVAKFNKTQDIGGNTNGTGRGKRSRTAGNEEALRIALGQSADHAAGVPRSGSGSFTLEVGGGSGQDANTNVGKGVPSKLVAIDSGPSYHGVQPSTGRTPVLSASVGASRALWPVD